MSKKFRGQAICLPPEVRNYFVLIGDGDTDGDGEGDADGDAAGVAAPVAVGVAE